MNGPAPTVAEKRWMDAICQLGCIVCRNEGHGETPASPHHIVEGRKKLGHMYTIPLCFRHHQEGSDNDLWTSRHPHKTVFERRYGTEYELLEQTVGLVKDLQARSIR